MKKKGNLITDHLVVFILLLAFLVIAALLIIMFYTEFDSEEMQMWSCWRSNELKSSNALFKATFPTTCKLMEPEEKADKATIAKMLKDTWWMYGKGTSDYSWIIGANDEEAVFYFTAKDSFTYEEFIQYLVYNNEDGKVTDFKDSDYNYLQKGSKGQTICYGEKIKGETGKPEIVAGKKYFIIFRDSRDEDTGDKIVIAGKPNYEQEGSYHCPGSGLGEVSVTLS